MNGNQGGLDLFGEQLPVREHAAAKDPSPEDFLFSHQQPTGGTDSATVLTTTTTPTFGMPLGRHAMPDPVPGQNHRTAPQSPVQQAREGNGRRSMGPAAPADQQQVVDGAPRPPARRPTAPVRRVDPTPARRERPMLQSLLLIGVVLTTSLGFASWIATEFGEYVLAGLAAVMGVVGSAFTWVLSRN